jgi:DNA-binding transcriptional MerR regulator/methylmalonyl-CoA mutase cobalamin-binding subunit
MRPNVQTAGAYSIRVASRLTGLSADTLRMWERRYGFPRPERNGSQIRVYSDADIERLALLARALKTGFRAGEVIRRSTDELRQVLAGSVHSRVASDAAGAPIVDVILEKLEQDDWLAVRAELRQAIAALGPKQFLIEVASALMDRVGEAWAAGRLEIRHERLLSEALRMQLYLLLAAHEGAAREPVVLLATLSNEVHGLAMEMAAVYLALEGAEPRLLGRDVPPQQIAAAASALGAPVVSVSISPAADAAETRVQLARLLRELPRGTRLWLGGRASASFELDDPRALRIATFPELERALLDARSQSNTTVLLP